MLPISHGDQVTQYLYDSIQISRLDSISLPQFYNLGQHLRTDSLASFFDALTIQISNSWTLTRITRLFALALLIINSINALRELSEINFRKILLITALILSLPDVWSVALSGKQDVYIWLFELTGVSIGLLLFRTKKLEAKLYLLSISLGLGIISTCSRLSSIAYLFACILLISFVIFSHIRREGYNQIKETLINLGSNYTLAFYLFIVVIAAVPCILNLIYLKNPFYVLSPPNIIEGLFPKAIYDFNYETYRQLFNLRINIPIISQIFSVIYAALGLEPIRYISSQLVALPERLNILNVIGPKDMMVSYLSLTPFLLIPFLRINHYKTGNHRNLIYMMALWLFLWASGITYTRVIVSCAITLAVIAISDNKLNYKNNLKLDPINLVTNMLVLYGLTCILAFTAWSLTTLHDLPLKELLTVGNYNKYELARSYIKNNYSPKTNIEVPSLLFQQQWRKVIANEPQKIKLLFNAPSQFAYFMDRGIIMQHTTSAKNYNKHKSNYSCYNLDEYQNIDRVTCDSYLSPKP